MIKIEKHWLLTITTPSHLLLFKFCTGRYLKHFEPIFSLVLSIEYTQYGMHFAALSTQTQTQFFNKLNSTQLFNEKCQLWYKRCNVSHVSIYGKKYLFIGCVGGFSQLFVLHLYEKHWAVKLCLSIHCARIIWHHNKYDATGVAVTQANQLVLYCWFTFFSFFSCVSLANHIVSVALLFSVLQLVLLLIFVLLLICSFSFVTYELI